MGQAAKKKPNNSGSDNANSTDAFGRENSAWLTTQDLIKAVIKGAWQEGLNALNNSRQAHQIRFDLTKNIRDSKQAKALQQHAQCVPSFESVLMFSTENEIWPDVHNILCQIKEVFSTSENASLVGNPTIVVDIEDESILFDIYCKGNYKSVHSIHMELLEKMSALPPENLSKIKTAINISN